MTEREWLVCTEAYQPLIFAREVASVRKLRLVSAAYARWLQSVPGYEDAKACADLIERMADQPIPRRVLEQELYALPGNWLLSHSLGPGDQVGKALNKMVWYAEDEFRQRQGDPEVPHSHVRNLLHEIVGNPFRPMSVDPAWKTSTVLTLARQMYESRDFSVMPILADALQDAGCDNDDVLDHCRDKAATHVRGCWVVDFLLGDG